MKRFLINFSYDGSGYKGFQKQNGLSTIQENMEKALKYINNGRDTKLVASGRTDAFVHANNQMAHADIYVNITEEKLKRALNHLSSLNNYELVISTKDKKYFININQMVYIEIRNHTIIYHLINEEIKGSGTLKSLYANLKKHHFAFCNQCYLVNLAFVKGIDDGYLLINNEKIRIASSRKKSFMQELTAYIGEI